MWLFLGSLGAVILSAATPIMTLQTGAKRPEVLTVGVNGVRAPAKVKGDQPVIPEGTQPRGVSVLEVLVSPKGTVDQVVVLRPIKPAAPELDKAAVDALKKWEFKPTIISGVAHPVKVRVSIDFFRLGTQKR